MKVDLAPGWKTELDRGPDWLIVILYGPEGEDADASGMAESLSSLMQQELKHRLLLELEHVHEIPRDLVAELLLLRDELDHAGAVLRVCGMLPEHESMLQQNGSQLPIFPDREAAILGFYRPGKPR